MEKKKFIITLKSSDERDSNISIKKTGKLGNMDAEESLYTMSFTFYDFLKTIGYTYKNIFEALTDVGHNLIENSMEDEDEHEKVFNNSKDDSTTEEDIERMVTDKDMFDTFYKELQEGDDEYKRSVFRSFLKDLND